MPDSESAVEAIIDLIPTFAILGLISNVLGIKVSYEPVISIRVPGWNYTSYQDKMTDYFADELKKHRRREAEGRGSALT